MNWLKWLHIPLAIVLCLLIVRVLEIYPTKAQSHTADVTITVSGEWPLAPTNFVATYVSETQVDLTWVQGLNTTHTIIVAKIGAYPTSITDGYIVYDGTSTNASDIGVNFDVVAGDIHYAAWGYIGINYSTDSAQTSIGGVSVILLALIFLPLGLTVAMFVSRQAMLGFPCALFWAVLGGYAYTQSTTPWGDWQYYLYFASAFGMTTFTALAAFGLREKRDTPADEGMERSEGPYIDEGREDGGKDKMDDVFSIEEDTNPSKRTRELRKRKEERRTRDSTPQRRISRWG